MSFTLEYSTNNSGGWFWLTTENWQAMEAAGWNVQWLEKHWAGIKAHDATIPVKDMDDAKRIIREWETITGQDAADEGCNCCGQPHNFTVTDENGRCVGDPVTVWSERGWS